jgi:regulator of RNase E activity RraA
MKKIVREHAAVDQALVDQFRAMHKVLSLSCVVADAQQRDNVMRSDIRLRSCTDKKIIGPAFTVKLTPGDLIDYLDVFKHLKAGDVLVVDAFGETETSVLGGLMASLCVAIGVAGAIVDGSVRDIDEARMIGFPVASKSVSPRSTHSPYSERTLPHEFNTRIVVGGVVVEPGDLIVADEIGIVVVPKTEMAEAYKAARAQAEREELQRADIASGATAAQLLAKYGRV